MRKFLDRLKALLSVPVLVLRMVDVTDLIDVAGVVLLVIGAAMVYRPAAFLVAGTALLAMSWHATRPVKPPRREDDDA